MKVIYHNISYVLCSCLFLLLNHTCISFCLKQVWFQNKRARTLKNRTTRTSPQPEATSSLPSPFLPPHMVGVIENRQPAFNGTQPQLREDTEQDCLFTDLSSQSFGLPPSGAHCSTPAIRPHQDRLMGTSLSPSSFHSDMEATPVSWSSMRAQTSPQCLWNPAMQGTGNSSKDESQVFLYPPPPYPHGSVRPGFVNSLKSTSPDSADSAFWDMGLENTSPMPYSQGGSGMWDESAEKQPLAPLPNLSPQCLQEVLGEMEPGWWKINGQMELQ